MLMNRKRTIERENRVIKETGFEGENKGENEGEREGESEGEGDRDRGRGSGKCLQFS